MSCEPLFPPTYIWTQQKIPLRCKCQNLLTNRVKSTPKSQDLSPSDHILPPPKTWWERDFRKHEGDSPAEAKWISHREWFCGGISRRHQKVGVGLFNLIANVCRFKNINEVSRHSSFCQPEWSYSCYFSSILDMIFRASHMLSRGCTPEWHLQTGH